MNCYKPVVGCYVRSVFEMGPAMLDSVTQNGTIILTNPM